MKSTIIACLLLTSLHLQAQDNSKDILTKMVSNVKAHQSISYTIDYNTLDVQGNDSHLSSMVSMMKDKTDTLWGGMTWMSEEAKPNAIYSFYDKNKMYTVMPPISKAYGDKPVKDRMGLAIGYNGLVWTDFLHPEAMERKYINAKDIAQQTDTMIKGKTCYKISLTPYYGATQFSETEILYINKADHFPVLIKNITTMTDGQQYTEMAFLNYAFDNVSPDKFSAKQIPATYKIETRDRQMPKGVQVEPRIDKSRFPLPGNGRR